MKTISTMACLLISLGAMAQYNKENLKLVEVSGALTYQNLRIYPIIANKTFEEAHEDVGKLHNLKDAMAQRKVKISEANDDVNNLQIQNVSSDTIIILAGEVVQGGKQDRMVAEDIVLYPKSGKKNLSVYCVEAGRWRANGSGTAFNDYFTISTTEVRQAAIRDKSQSKVWEKVGETNSKNNVSSSTSALTAMKHNQTLTDELKKYSGFFSTRLINDPTVIGLVAVTGNKVLGCDMFATNDLFKSYYSGLIDSYATEAITSGSTITINFTSVQKYLDEIISDEKSQERKIKEKGTLLKGGDKKLHLSTF